MLGKVFDKYDTNARLYPALIVLVPVILDVYLFVPETREIFRMSITIAVSLGLLKLLATIARNIGKNKQNILYKQWGGIPTSRFLRHSDNTIDPLTKARYHRYLTCSINGFKPPSLYEELADMEAADRIYESAVRWLREKTRDTKRYPLVFKENVSYGFSRNLWSLKNIGIPILLVSMILRCIFFYMRQGSNLLSLPYSYFIANIISFVLLLIWIFFVNKQFVKNAAEAYARALLAVCDENMLGLPKGMK